MLLTVGQPNRFLREFSSMDVKKCEIKGRLTNLSVLVLFQLHLRVSSGKEGGGSGPKQLF